MPTSRRRPAETFGEQALALAWGAWAELGVSSFTETHSNWVVDPEPLIVLTAHLGDADPRLRDEATDWCIHYWRFVSKSRLRNLLRDQPAETQEAFGEFSATVAEHSGVRWPGATEPRTYRVTGRSALPPLERPSLAWLRLRAMFGVGARSEILRYFLATGGRRATVAVLAAATTYTKRNVIDECETLEKAGVLSQRAVGNRFWFSLARRAELERFVGEIGDVRPDWIRLLNITRGLVDLEADIDRSTPRTVPVKVRRALDDIEDDLAELDIDNPADRLNGAELWPATQAMGRESLGAWSLGRWPSGEEELAPVRRLRRTST